MQQVPITEYTDLYQGLTEAEVQQRVKQGKTNKLKKVVGKSYLQIFAGNIFTFFNLLGFIIFILMAFFGEPSEMLFIVVILSNTVIGIFQEIRSKLAVEKLSLVSEPTAEVVRDGQTVTVKTDEVVLDDIVVLASGAQVCSDCVIVSGEAEVNESMLTGESVAVKKKKGDMLFRGSFVIAGNCSAQAVKVGKDTYIEQLSARVKKAKVPDSQLIKGIMAIIKVIAIIIFPLGFLTFLFYHDVQALLQNGMGFFEMWGQFFSGNAEVVHAVRAAVQSASGSMLGMVPSGMVLLTSIALAVGALKLARKKVLVRELPCIEMLARVDTLCLDKTGTITDGSMTVEHVIALDGNEDNLKCLVASVVAGTGDDNMTAKALKAYTDGVETLDDTAHMPFSSARKYSAATFAGVGTIAVGAAEFMFKRTDKDFDKQCDELLSRGLRVLAVGKTKQQITDDGVSGLVPVGIIALQDTVRSDAPEIIKWFADNSVAVKVISGDNPLSVSVIAQKVGIPQADKYVSLEGMTDEQVAEAANNYTVFGRVTPEQKAVLVRAMKAAGHTVAMTGDGVNDILAMRESDCAISVGCGTDAAKTVANLVLTDNKFGSMPGVVAEGRQVVNNIQNSSSLFLMKTTMTVLVTILTLCLGVSFPFRPSNLSAVNLFVIGIASFLLALKPNKKLISGKFLVNTLRSTLPGGLGMFLSVAMVYAFRSVIGIAADEEMITTTAMVAMSFTGVCALWMVCFPFDWYNVGVASLGTAGVCAMLMWFQPLYIWAMTLIKGDGFTMERPYIVPVTDAAKIFVVCDVVAMFGTMLLTKFLVAKLSTRKSSPVPTEQLQPAK
jgi:HAD ATPase, P-type, family IC